MAKILLISIMCIIHVSSIGQHFADAGAMEIATSQDLLHTLQARLSRTVTRHTIILKQYKISN